MLSNMLFVGIGGFLGAISRFGIIELEKRLFPGAMNLWGVFFCNVLGSFIMGFFLVFVMRNILGENLKFLLLTGFLGSFTTFSTFSAEVFQFFRKDDYSSALIYISSSLFFGIGALFLAFYLTSKLTSE